MKEDVSTQDSPIEKQAIPMPPSKSIQRSTPWLWKGRIVPSILRGSEAHNKKVLEERAKALEARAEAINQACEILKTDSEQQEHIAAGSLMELRAMLCTQAKKVLSERNIQVTEKSILHCDETLEASPQSSPQKKIPLSPFSQAKEMARRNGVNLSEDCRGVYSDADLMERIAFLGSVNKKFKA